MSNEQMDNLDELFRKAVEPLETEPSEKFWKGAADDVLERSSKASERKTRRWRIAAFILAAALVASGYFWVNLEKGIHNTETNSHSKSVTTSIGNTAEKVIPAGIGYNLNKPVATANTTEKIDDKVAANNSKTETEQLNTKQSAPYIVLNNAITNPQKAKHSQPLVATNTVAAKNEQPAENASQLPAENRVGDKKEATPPVKNEPIVQQMGASQVMNATQPNAKQPSAANIGLGPISSGEQKTQLAVDSTKKKSEWLKLYALLSPDFSLGYQYKCNSPTASETENNISREKQNFSFSAGAGAEIRVAKHFYIGTGIGYESYSFDSKQGIITAKALPGGDAGYSVTTSSGVVNCPYYGPVKVGDSLQMKASSSRSYVNIPIIFKYNFINKNKFSVYVVAAPELNISTAISTTMNWERGYYWGESTVDGAEGASRLCYTGYLGAGAALHAGKKINVFLEPGVHTALSPIMDADDVNTYPTLFTLKAGMEYILK